jgi:hypothetical protein
VACGVTWNLVEESRRSWVGVVEKLRGHTNLFLPGRSFHISYLPQLASFVNPSPQVFIEKFRFHGIASPAGTILNQDSTRKIFSFMASPAWF